MAWPIPQHSRSKVNWAGEILRLDPPGAEWGDFERAHTIMSNWRACHGYPINTFQSTLRTKAKQLDQSSIVAQRLKRVTSIRAKLRRYEKMKLARMQDIGGLRAVVSTLSQLRKLDSMYEGMRIQHELVDTKDYVKSPKDSGYRSIHRVYRYRNRHNPAYDGLLVELQFRTLKQHVWATAVETMGTFLDHALKSSEGPEKYLEFFSLAGAAFAHMEGTRPVEKFSHLSKEDTYHRVTELADKLDIVDTLRGFNIATNRIYETGTQGQLHLIHLDIKDRMVRYSSYGLGDLEKANARYAELEKRVEAEGSGQVVLVSAGPVSALRKAYPNYFLDTTRFIKALSQIRK